MQLRGGHGKAAEIYVNGSAASLDSVIKIGDEIRVVPAENGKNAQARVSDVAGRLTSGKVDFNGSAVDISTKVYINGMPAAIDSRINEGDCVKVGAPVTLLDLMSAHNMDFSSFEVRLNGEEVNTDAELKDSDTVECFRRQASDYAGVTAGRDEINDAAGESVQITGTPAREKKLSNADSKISAESSFMHITVNGDTVVLKGDKAKYIFVDVFNYINFDISRPQGNIVLRLNGKQAAFTDEIKAGDIIDIYWEKQG
jgi:sulfur carrier protein ThiS